MPKEEPKLPDAGDRRPTEDELARKRLGGSRGSPALPPAPRPVRIFVSHSTKYHDLAKGLANALESLQSRVPVEVLLCEEMGIPTGIDLDRLIALSRSLPALLGHEVPGQVAKAGRNRDLHAVPDTVRNIR